MKLLLASVELAPFTPTSEDPVEPLATQLAQLGHSVSVVLPYHRQIRENKAVKARATGMRLRLPVGTARHECEVLESSTEHGVQVFFIRRDEYFDRSGILGAEGKTYEDNAERFIYFTKAVAELARHLDPAPDILHAFGWQAALLPVFVRNQHLPFATALSLTDVSTQGNFWSYDFALTNLPQEMFSASGVEYYGSLNFAKGGIVFADVVIVPGERFAAEIRTDSFGNGLGPVFRAYAGKLVGIPKGMDHDEWNPATDKSLVARFSLKDLPARGKNKASLLKSLNLAPDPVGPVILVGERILDQTAWNRLSAIVDRLLEQDVRLLIAPCCDSPLPISLHIAAKKHCSQMAILQSEVDFRTLIAGSDIFLLPGRFHLHAGRLIRAMRYGAVPLAGDCAGIEQFVSDYGSQKPTGNGFLFFRDNPEALLDSLRYATSVFSDRSEWLPLVQRTMEADHSYRNSAKLHEKVYQRIHHES